MFKKILYPTDFSGVAKRALEYVKKLKEAGARTVVVLHVIDERMVWAAAGDAKREIMDVPKLKTIMEELAKNDMKPIESELKEQGFNVKVRIEEGIPLREILRVQEEENVSAVVIGSHGKSMVEEMLLGSVSEKVIRKSKRPVLVVRRSGSSGKALD